MLEHPAVHTLICSAFHTQPLLAPCTFDRVFVIVIKIGFNVISRRYAYSVRMARSNYHALLRQYTHAEPRERAHALLRARALGGAFLISR